MFLAHGATNPSYDPEYVIVVFIVYIMITKPVRILTAIVLIVRYSFSLLVVVTFDVVGSVVFEVVDDIGVVPR